eukprot:6206623-Pleurochrysis_carterae.AAC.1
MATACLQPSLRRRDARVALALRLCSQAPRALARRASRVGAAGDGAVAVHLHLLGQRLGRR